MAVQTTGSVTNLPFWRAGELYASDSETFLQDAGRSADLLIGTVVSQDPATRKWVPYTDITATDGTEIPSGIILETIPTASLVAGDVADVHVLVGGQGVIVRKGDLSTEGGLILENSVVLTAEIVSQNKTVERALRDINVYVQETLATEWLQS